MLNSHRDLQQCHQLLWWNGWDMPELVCCQHGTDPKYMSKCNSSYSILLNMTMECLQNTINIQMSTLNMGLAKELQMPPTMDCTSWQYVLSLSLKGHMLPHYISGQNHESQSRNGCIHGQYKDVEYLLQCCQAGSINENISTELITLAWNFTGKWRAS